MDVVSETDGNRDRSTNGAPFRASVFTRSRLFLPVSRSTIHPSRFSSFFPVRFAKLRHDPIRHDPFLIAISSPFIFHSRSEERRMPRRRFTHNHRRLVPRSFVFFFSSLLLPFSFPFENKDRQTFNRKCTLRFTIEFYLTPN